MRKTLRTYESMQTDGIKVAFPDENIERMISTTKPSKPLDPDGIAPIIILKKLGDKGASF